MCLLAEFDESTGASCEACARRKGKRVQRETEREREGKIAFC